MQLTGRGLIWTRLQGFGSYAFIVKGCDSPTIGEDRCRQGWTIPVRVSLGSQPGVMSPPGPAVTEPIAERWHELGAWSGPLGRPTSAAEFNPGNGVTRQLFDMASARAPSVSNAI
jgi:hypothetical protein